MACKNICRLCNNLVISSAVSFTTPNLVVTIPQASYNDEEKVCIVVSQAIPTTTPVDAPVQIQIGTGTALYPLLSCDCEQVTARAIRTRTKYSTIVKTSATSGAFKLLGHICNLPDGLNAIDGTT